MHKKLLKNIKKYKKYIWKMDQISYNLNLVILLLMNKKIKPKVCCTYKYTK